METRIFSATPSTNKQGFQLESFLVKKFQESVDEWIDISKCPEVMLDILLQHQRICLFLENLI